MMRMMMKKSTKRRTKSLQEMKMRRRSVLVERWMAKVGNDEF
jgi:hypothetical protein